MSLEKKLEALTEAIAGLTVALQTPVIATSPAPTEKEPKPKPKKQKETAPEPTAPSPEPTAETAPTEVAEPEGSSMTMEDVREKLTPVVEEHGAAFIQKVLSRMGVKKLSELDPSSYDELFDIIKEETA